MPRRSDSEPIHAWFSLSYAAYLVLPRVVLQSAPLDWQRKFVDLLAELDAASRDLPEDEYRVLVGEWVETFEEDEDGDPISEFRELPSKLPNYERGRARVSLSAEAFGGDPDA